MTTIEPQIIAEVGEYLVSQLKEGRSLEFALATTQRVYGDQNQPAPIDPHPKPYGYEQLVESQLNPDAQQAISQKFAQETHESIQNLQHRIRFGPDTSMEIPAKMQPETLVSMLEAWAHGLERGDKEPVIVAMRSIAKVIREDETGRQARAEAEDIAVRDAVYEWATGLPDGRFVALLETTGLTGYIQATPEEHVSLAKEVLARVRRD